MIKTKFDSRSKKNSFFVDGITIQSGLDLETKQNQITKKDQWVSHNS